ncbi:MAG: ABC transporter ATP-binding protein [bacterium]
MTSPSTPPLAITIKRASEQERQQRPLEWRLIRRLFFYTKPHARIRNTLTGLVLIRALQIPLLAWSIGAIINGPITRGDFKATVWCSLGFGLLAAITQLTFHFRMRLGLLLGERVIHDLRREIFAHLLRMPMSYFNKTKLGRIISRLTSDVEAVRIGVQDIVFVACVQGGQMIIAAIMMLWIDWRLFLVVMAMAPVIWGLNRVFQKRWSAATRANQESFSRITATLSESVSGIRVTQGFVRQSLNSDIFSDLVADHSQSSLDLARTSGTFLPLLEFSSQFFTAALILLGGYFVITPSSHPMPVGTLIQFFFLTGTFFNPITSLGNLYNQAMVSMAGAERVFEVLDTAPEWTDSPTARTLPNLKGHVECRSLTFGYDPTRPILMNIDLVAEPGQTVALVGHTGSGKTSLINLIAKFYLPTQGEIRVDGVNLLDIQTGSLHQQMALIQQSNYVFTGTIMENIRIGRPEATDVEVIDAARQLDCIDLLEALPQGFQTPVGEHGAGLSLGQRQLVCFVRAMLANPRILILDEATSSVDTMTEVRIQKALSTLLKNRTCFIIAHRLSTVRHADQVIVLDHGRIIERGTHTGLLAKHGAYANLYRQFARLGLGGGKSST